ncbi:hypothetical protein [Hymenobacter terrenus]|uniref:hypothetical protein n=1 Tax=Hymenobacter terrenus TaxID=1629124 RepID=UPI0006193B48|nr:hypothetical protein [Hymenobacter terrenus]
MNYAEVREYITQQALNSAPVSLETACQAFGPLISQVVNEDWQLVLFQVAIMPYTVQLEGAYITAADGTAHRLVQPWRFLPSNWDESVRRLHLLSLQDGAQPWNCLDLTFGPIPAASLQTIAQYWDTEQETHNQSLIQGVEKPEAPPLVAAPRPVANQPLQLYDTIAKYLLSVLPPSADCVQVTVEQELLMPSWLTKLKHLLYATEGQATTPLTLAPAPALLHALLRIQQLSTQGRLPDWSTASLSVFRDGRCHFTFFASSRNQPLGNWQHTGVMHNGQYSASIPIETPLVAPPLEEVYHEIAQALRALQTDKDSTLLLTLELGKGPRHPPEIQFINYGNERDYSLSDDDLPQELVALLQLFLETSQRDGSSWRLLYVLLRTDTTVETGLLPAAALLRPESAADMLPAYAEVLTGLLPQTQAGWATVEVSSGYGDGVPAYDAICHYADGRVKLLEVCHSARTMIALDYIYCYGWQAADCNWNNVQFRFKPNGKYQAKFFLPDYRQPNGWAKKAKHTSKGQLPLKPSF